MAWSPNPYTTTEILSILRESRSPNQEIQRAIHNKIAQLQTMPDFNNYLVYILKLTSEDEYTRTVAGLLLKANISSSYSKLLPQVQVFLKNEILPCVADPVVSVRHTAGTIITTIVTKEDFTAWPNLLPTLVQLLDSPDFNQVEGAFNTLFKLCEDNTRKFDLDAVGRPLNYIIPKLLSFFQSPNDTLRQYAIGCINQFLLDMPAALSSRIDQYLQGIFYLATDSNAEVRKRVCQAFVVLLDMRLDYLMPHMRNVVQYMIHCTQDDYEPVALEACEFWAAITETKICQEVMREWLPMLVPILLRCMVYSDDDPILLANEEEDNAMIPDQTKDIRPIHVRSRAEDLDSDSDDSEQSTEWNLRRSAAAGLDALATVFRNDMLPILFPHLEKGLNEKSDWKVKEAAVLAIGAVAEGCMEGLAPYLPQLLPHLLTLLSDSRPLIRSITCWTISRYSTFIATQEPEKFLRPVVNELLRCICDRNKRVQEAACSAFATLEEQAGSELLPHLGLILQTLMWAFNHYQAKNLLILYDAIATLADAVGSNLNQPQYIAILLPPFIAKWNSLEDSDRGLLPLLEALTAIAIALGPGFQEYAAPVFARCVRLIESVLWAAAMAEQQHEALDSSELEFLVCALDLISGLVEGLRGSSEQLIGQSNLLNLLYECCKSSSPDVRQSSFALIGDLARHAINFLRPGLPTLMPILIHNLQLPEFVSACNNACWALGEICLRAPDDVRPFAPAMMTHLVPLINRLQINRGLLENAAITIGRLGLVAPDVVAVNLEDFIQRWCMALRNVRDDSEKDSAFRGLCQLIKTNPRGVIKHFLLVCDAIASWIAPKPDLKEMFYQILHGFKNSVTPQAWADYFNSFPAQLRQALHNQYGL